VPRRLGACLASPDVLDSHPERQETAGLEAADDADVCAGPLRGLPVEFTFAAVDPLDVHRDRNGRLVVFDVVPDELTM
jgi:hypothetical protein